MRILAVDIETAPNEADVWGLWNQNVGLNQLRKSAEMMCWVAKWVGDRGTEFRSVHHDGKAAMVERIWTLLDEADVVMHYNGRRFDVPHIQREFVQHDPPLLPPSLYKQIDLLDVVKRQFNFPSYKLEYVAGAKGLDLGGKVSTGGHELWTRCRAGDEAAWNRMRRYNKRDVVLLERLYERLRPWVPSHPNVALYDGKPDGCPSCGSENSERRGFARTSVSAYQRFQCQDCGRWFRGTRRVEHVEVREAAA